MNNQGLFLCASEDTRIPEIEHSS